MTLDPGQRAWNAQGHSVTMTRAPVPLELLSRYDVPGPRYTSYPTADRFVEAFGPTDCTEALARRRDGPAAFPLPLSLYVHIPFCESLCYYCGCNKIITKHHERAQAYLRYLARHPATARRLARKLALRYVSDTPSTALVDHLAQVYLDHETAIVPVLRALVAHPEFVAAVGQKVRTPADDVVATWRAPNAL